MTIFDRIHFTIASLLRMCGTLLPRRRLRGVPRECVVLRPSTTEIVETPPGRIAAVMAAVPVTAQTAAPSGPPDTAIRRIPLYVIRSVFETGAAADAAWVFQMKRCEQDDPVLVHIRPIWPPS